MGRKWRPGGAVGPSPGDGAGCWLVVSSPDNFEATRKLRFSLQGFKGRHRRKVERMRPGDRLVWYLTGLQRFQATATVVSVPFEDHERIWTAGGKPEEDYPWRVRIRPDVVLEPGDGVRAAELRESLEHVARWPAQHWRLAFQGMLHRWTPGDLRLVENALRARGERSVPSPPRPSRW